MRKSGICPKCKSQAIIENVRVPEHAHYNGILFLSILISGKKTNWFSNRSAKGELRTWICAECGYTEFYTMNSKELFQVYQEWLEEQNQQGQI